jgi:hypothetical protein
MVCGRIVRGRGGPKDSWMVVVDKFSKNKIVRSTKCKTKSQKNIMGVEEASGVCKDRFKWRSICRGWKNEGRYYVMLLAYPVMGL